MHWIYCNRVMVIHVHAGRAANFTQQLCVQVYSSVRRSRDQRDGFSTPLHYQLIIAKDWRKLHVSQCLILTECHNTFLVPLLLHLPCLCIGLHGSGDEIPAPHSQLKCFYTKCKKKSCNRWKSSSQPAGMKWGKPPFQWRR